MEKSCIYSIITIHVQYGVLHWSFSMVNYQYFLQILASASLCSSIPLRFRGRWLLSYCVPWPPHFQRPFVDPRPGPPAEGTDSKRWMLSFTVESLKRSLISSDFLTVFAAISPEKGGLTHFSVLFFLLTVQLLKSPPARSPALAVVASLLHWEEAAAPESGWKMTFCHSEVHV